MSLASKVKAKGGSARVFVGGVIMDVVSAEQAKIAEQAGARAVMALERVPADIRAAGGVARMASPRVIEAIKNAVGIPVMAKARIGHIAEAQVLQELGVDFVDESEVLTPADDQFHIDKFGFGVPFVCGCRDLGEALRRLAEGAAMIRTKGEAGTGDVSQAVRHVRTVMSEIRRVVSAREDELVALSKEMQAPYELVAEVHRSGSLPVPNLAAGGVATPADASLLRQLGADGVFVGSGVFKSEDPEARAVAIVRAVEAYDNPGVVTEVSRELGEAMAGTATSELEEGELLQHRGW